MLHTFQQNLKSHVGDYNDVNFNVQPNLFKQYAIFENKIITKKLSFLRKPILRRKRKFSNQLLFHKK